MDNLLKSVGNSPLKRNILIILLALLMSACTTTAFTQFPTQWPSTSTVVIPTNTKALTPIPIQLTLSPTIFIISPGESIQAAINSASAGDIVRVLGGDYDERISVEKTLIIEALGDVTTQGFLIQADGVIVRGFKIINLTGPGIQVKSGNKGIIEDNQFLYNGHGGLQLYNGTNEWVVRNNLFHRNNLYAAQIEGKNHMIEGNEVTQTIQHHPCVPTAKGADADGFRFHGSGHVFKNNYIHDMPDGHVGYDQTACNIEELANLENDYDNNSHTDCFQTYEGGYHVAGHDVLFGGNVCKLPYKDEQTAGFNSKMFNVENGYNLTIRNNLVMVDAISLFRNCHNIVFDHNTFIASNSTLSVGVKYYNCGADAGSVKNNIFVGYRSSSGVFDIKNSKVIINNNCIYTPGYVSTKAPNPGDVWNLDPLLDADYHLLPESPCIAAADDGSDIGAFP